MTEELGVEPGFSLRELEQAILRQEPFLEVQLFRERASDVAAGIIRRHGANVVDTTNLGRRRAAESG